MGMETQGQTTSERDTFEGIVSESFPDGHPVGSCALLGNEQFTGVYPVGRATESGLADQSETDALMRAHPDANGDIIFTD